MMSSNRKCFAFILISAFISVVRGVTYQELKDLNVTCPERDRCEGYKNNRDYTDRSCECDSDCTIYKDCCADATPRENTGRPASESNLTCMHYGTERHTGVYAVTSCSHDWNGPKKIREKCEGPIDYSDPLNASPLTSSEHAVTYRNVYCAECNNADVVSLSTFQMQMDCDGLSHLTEDQVLADMMYNEELNTWGINRPNSFGNATNFFRCDVIFEVPSNLNNRVRFCRANVISSCAPGWDRQAVRRACEDYMTVVYYKNVAYRNPHCAICNYRNVDDISCTTEILRRKKKSKPFTFLHLLDTNRSDGQQDGKGNVTTPLKCSDGQRYDPLYNMCRQLVCALPGYVVVKGICLKA